MKKVPSSISDNSEFITMIKQGDVAAYKKLFESYYDLLCNFSTHFTHNKEISKEIVDDVMLYLWNNREGLEILNLEAYLFRATRNRSLNIIHSKAYRVKSLFQNISNAEAENFIVSLFPENEPLGTLLVSELKDQVKKAIDELPVKTREVFMLCKVEGEKYEEVADKLNISVNTVKYHMKNAMRLLMTKLSFKSYIFLLFLLIKK